MLAGTGTVDTAGLLAIVVPLSASIIGGGFAMAWRLGGLERTVLDQTRAVARIDHHLELLDAKTDAATSAATAAAAAATVANTRDPNMRTRREDREGRNG